MAPDDHHHHEEADFADLLNLDAEVLRDYLTALTGWIAELTDGAAPSRILDLGSGTGTGALALAGRFPGAHVTAVDQSGALLGHLRDKAHDLDLADRIDTVEADLDTGWPGFGPVDLVWASASLHHLADPGRVLTEVFGALRPGGLLVAVELDSFPRFLPGDLAGVEARVHQVSDAIRAEHLPLFGSDWGPVLGKAGFIVEASRVFTIDLSAPLPAATGRYAKATLQRLRGAVQGRLNSTDLAALDALLAGDALLRRDDLEVHTTRTVWVARRP
jgi:SAM-dependent methyltransferase